MPEIAEIMRLIALLAFIWNFAAAKWRHEKGGDWQYSAFLALVFMIAASGGA